MKTMQDAETLWRGRLREMVNCDSPTHEKKRMDALMARVECWGAEAGAACERLPQASYGDLGLPRFDGQG